MMRVRAGVFILAMVLVLAGVYVESVLLPALIAAAVLLLVSREPKKGGGGSGAKVKVQPIIVKRKYEGPESIYPKEITITEPGSPPTRWKEAGKHTGSLVGKSLKKFVDWLIE